MKKLTSVLAAVSLLLPLQAAENLLRNPGFEDAQAGPWQFWPGSAAVSTKDPASGKQCLAVPQLSGRREYLLQKNIPVEPGCACICSLKSRADDCAGPLEVNLIFRDASGIVVNSVKVITGSVSKDWSGFRGAGIASEKAVTADVSIELPSGNGIFFLDDVSLEQGSRILGTHGASRVDRTKEGIRIVSPSCTLDFIENRNFGLASAEFGGKRRIRNFFLCVPLQNENRTQSSFFLVNRNIVTDLKLKEKDDSILFTVEETYPHLQVRRSVECWNNAPYVKFIYELKARKDFISSRVSMDFGFTGSVIAQGRVPHLIYTKWSKPNHWFNLERPDDPRVISYLDRDGKNGLALISLDKTDWEELPGKLLSNTSGKNGDGFGIGLVKWGGRDTRKGDKVSCEVLVAPVESHEQAVELADRLCIAD